MCSEQAHTLDFEDSEGVLCVDKAAPELLLLAGVRTVRVDERDEVRELPELGDLQVHVIQAAHKESQLEVIQASEGSEEL